MGKQQAYNEWPSALAIPSPQTPSLLLASFLSSNAILDDLPCHSLDPATHSPVLLPCSGFLPNTTPDMSVHYWVTDQLPPQRR